MILGFKYGGYGIFLLIYVCVLFMLFDFYLVLIVVDVLWFVGEGLSILIEVMK